MPSHPETRRATPFILWGSVLVATILVAFGVRYLTRDRVEVTTARVTYKDLVKTSPTIGKVEPIEDFQPHAQVAGVVEDIYVGVGDKVKPGQLLLKLDDADARARLAQAESALKAAELSASDIAHGGTQDERNTYASDLGRARLQRDQDQTSLAALVSLQKQGSASPAEVSAAQQRLLVDDANIHSIEQHSTQRYGDADRAGAQAKIADAEAAVSAARSAVASVNIHSPIAGTVYSAQYSQYDYVAPSSDEPALIYVADLNRIKVTAYFDEPEIGSLAVGQPVDITWDAKPGKVWHGHISIAPTSIIAYNTRNVGECEITVDNAHGELPPNANVNVTVTTLQRFHVLSVPREALHTKPGDHIHPGENYVFRVINNKLVRTPVQIGSATNLVSVEITGGLAEGDVVALSGPPNRDLTDGLEVKPIE
jgi:HlyD family secretion protein